MILRCAGTWWICAFQTTSGSIEMKIDKRVDRAPGADRPDLVDPKRGAGNDCHQRDLRSSRWSNADARPLGAANWTSPGAKAAIAAKAWSRIAGAASSSGARLICRA